MVGTQPSCAYSVDGALCSHSPLCLCSAPGPMAMSSKSGSQHLLPHPHLSLYQIPLWLILGACGFPWKKRPRIEAYVISSDFVFLQEGLWPFVFFGCQAGTGAICGSLFPSTPHVQRSEGISLPQMGRKASQRRCRHPTCCEEQRRSPAVLCGEGSGSR